MADTEPLRCKIRAFLPTFYINIKYFLQSATLSGAISIQSPDRLQLEFIS